MRVLVGALLLVVALGATGCGGDDDRADTRPTPAPPTVRVVLSPQTGDKATAFVARITTVKPTGVLGDTLRSYAVEARAVDPASACVNNRDRSFPTGQAGARVSATLDPMRGEGGELGWCRGLFRARVTYIEAFACPATGTCKPTFPSRTDVVASVTFRVR